MRRVILASHGGLAQGTKASLEMILGERREMEAYGMYPGESAADFAAQLEKRVEAGPEDEFIIAADLYGASVCNAMYPLTRYANVRLFAGFNLQFLVQLFCDYDSPLTDSDAETLLTDAREGLRRIDYSTPGNIEEDF